MRIEIMLTEQQKQPKTKNTKNGSTEPDLVSKFNRLKKTVRNNRTEILSLKKRLFAVTKELKALKKDCESHLKNIKRAERIDRKLEAEKSKLKRKVLKSGSKKPRDQAQEDSNANIVE